MNQLRPAIILASLLCTIVLPVSAQNASGLSPEQLEHERKLTDLRKQKEILEIKHAQARLLRECKEMGVDCRGTELEVVEHESDDFDEQITDIIAQERAMAMPAELGGNEGSDSDEIPQLTAIQNSSAQLELSDSPQWALVGEMVGNWKVLHIDASKVRIKNIDNAMTKTLVLNW